MKDIISFCIKTSSAFTDDINKTENKLTILLEKKTYDKVKQTINKVSTTDQWDSKNFIA